MNSLREIGNAFYAYRAEVLVSHGEGLTKTFRRFHDPNEKSKQIQRLRELYNEMDSVVLRAYGWNDLVQTAHCEFLLDFEEPEDEEGNRKMKRRRPWRLRWPDSLRDEVLGRLLELNEKRAKTEALSGISAEASKVRTGDCRQKRVGVSSQHNLFE